MMDLIKGMNLWPVNEGVTLSTEVKTNRILCVRKNFNSGYPLTLIDSYNTELSKFYSMHIPHSSHLGKYDII
jgi:uncharacterized membrane protein